MCNKHVHSTMTRSSRFHCLIGVINSAPPDTPAGGEEASFPIPKNPTPLSGLWASGFGPSGFTPDTNTRLGPSQHDGLDPPMRQRTSSIIVETVDGHGLWTSTVIKQRFVSSRCIVGLRQSARLAFPDYRPIPISDHLLLYNTHRSLRCNKVQSQRESLSFRTAWPAHRMIDKKKDYYYYHYYYYTRLMASFPGQPG